VSRGISHHVSLAELRPTPPRFIAKNKRRREGGESVQHSSTPTATSWSGKKTLCSSSKLRTPPSSLSVLISFRFSCDPPRRRRGEKGEARSERRASLGSLPLASLVQERSLPGEKLQLALGFASLSRGAPLPRGPA
jgi:hypothetical protein